MPKYIAKRLVLAVVTILITSALTFFLMNLVPGGPFLSEKAPSQATLDALNKKYGLDEPLIVQYGNYMKNYLKGDMGVSFKLQKNRPVSKIIAEMFPVSAKVGAIALTWAIIVGLLLGCLAAYKNNRLADNIIRILTAGGISLPDFVTAAILLVVFAGGVFKIFPTTLNSSWQSYVLPCFTLGLRPMCSIAKYTRSSMLDVLGQEYIKTAKAKGLPPFKIVFKHSLRNALIPVVTYIGPLVAALLTGSFVVEKAFNIPGLGDYFVRSISNRDYPLIMGTTIFLTILIVLISLIVDILYHVIDPRIDLTKGASN